jgi:single-strand DNA-binding protein
MGDVNKAFFHGRLTRDPEIRAAGKTDILEFSVAVNEFYKKSGDDEYTKIVHYFDCQLWGARGKAISKFLEKGTEVFIEASIKQDRWEDKDTRKARSKIVFNVQEINFPHAEGGDRGKDDDRGGRARDDDRGGRERDDDRGGRSRDDDRGGRKDDRGGNRDRPRDRDDDRPPKKRDRDDDFEDDIPF